MAKANVHIDRERLIEWLRDVVLRDAMGIIDRHRPHDEECKQALDRLLDCKPIILTRSGKPFSKFSRKKGVYKETLIKSRKSKSKKRG